MLCPDVRVIQTSGLLRGELEDPLRSRRERDLRWRGHRVSASNDEFDRRADLRKLDAEARERASRDAFALPYEAEQEVLGPEVVVVEADRFVLRERDIALRAVVEVVERSLSAGERAGRRQVWPELSMLRLRDRHVVGAAQSDAAPLPARSPRRRASR